MNIYGVAVEFREKHNDHGSISGVNTTSALEMIIVM